MGQQVLSASDTLFQYHYKLAGERKGEETSAMAEWFAQNPKNLHSRTERMHRGLELKSRKENSACFELRA